MRKGRTEVRCWNGVGRSGTAWGVVRGSIGGGQAGTKCSVGGGKLMLGRREKRGVMRVSIGKWSVAVLGEFASQRAQGRGESVARGSILLGGVGSEKEAEEIGRYTSSSVVVAMMKRMMMN